MQTLTQKMTPRCFGRYLVDLPEDIVLNSDGEQEIDGVKIDIIPMKQHEFGFMLENRTAELERTVMISAEGYPLLRKAIPLPDGTAGVVFDRAESAVSGGRLSRMYELLAWKDGYRIRATITATDTTFPEDANDADLQALTNTTSESLAQLLNVFNRTRGRADDDIPTEQGVCILNGFVSGPPTDQEDAGNVYDLRTAEDVYFTFHTHSIFVEEDTLLDRVPAVRNALIREGEQVLRADRRIANGIEGEELLFKIVGDDGMLKKNPLTHNFIFEANGKTCSAMTPFIRVSLINGKRKPEPSYRVYPNDFPLPIEKATLSDAEAIALWDAVIPTIRPRPGAF